jgi:TorA maturation chaperone TorD
MSKEKLKDMAGMARHRGNVYSLLAATFSGEPSAAFIRQIKDPKFRGALSGAGVEFEEEVLNQPEDKLIEDLAIEYTRLFLGPGKHISPHESVHHERDDGDWGRLWGADTVAVKKFIESAGLEYKTEYTGLPDQISVELEFMQQVTNREARAWEAKDSKGALYCLKMEKKFMDEHLAQWIPIFCDKVISEAELPFYREMAKLTKNFVKFEQEELGKKLLKTP